MGNGIGRDRIDVQRILWQCMVEHSIPNSASRIYAVPVYIYRRSEAGAEVTSYTLMPCVDLNVGLGFMVLETDTSVPLSYESHGSTLYASI